MHFILCDEIDSGKSTFCMELVRRIADQRLFIGGFVTPAHMEGSKKRGHDFVAIEGGTIEAAVPFTRMGSFSGSFPFMKYHFSAGAFGRAALLPRGEGLFIMDEVGPLELSYRRGFYGTISRAFESDMPTLSVVRKGLDRELRSAFSSCRFTVYSLDEKDKLESDILSLLHGLRKGGRGS